MATPLGLAPPVHAEQIQPPARVGRDGGRFVVEADRGDGEMATVRAARTAAAAFAFEPDLA